MSIPLIKHSALVGRLIIDPRTAMGLGHISQLLIDVRSHRVAGVRCILGDSDRNVYDLRWADIVVGADHVFLNGKQQTPLEASGALVAIIGLGLWDESGTAIGVIGDYYLHPKTGCIMEYLFILGGWQGLKYGLRQLPTTAIAHANTKGMVIENEAIHATNGSASYGQEKPAQTLELVS